MELIQINGIGEKVLKKLAKKNINNIQDFLTFYPINYQSYSTGNLIDQQNIIIKGTIIRNISEYRPRFNLLITTYFVSDNGTEYKIIAWNQKHLRFTLKEGDLVEIKGVYDAKKNQIVQKNLKKITSLETNTLFDSENITPIYSKITGLSNQQIQKFILKTIEETTDYQYKEALIAVHNPQKYEDITKGKKYLKYQEFYTYYSKLQKLKNKKDNFNLAYKKKIDENYYNHFLYHLPFTLTTDQEIVLKKLINNLKSEQLMQTLILGDVGSGKTIIAIIISLLINKNKGQIAMMAPTEVLAKQLYANFKNYLPEANCELLISNLPKREKNKIKDRALLGISDIVIGTHALIQDDVEFKNLELAIIDEQHRFGVEQRNKLINKTNYGEFIYLSATPIPRTLAQSMFGVMNVEFIKTKPLNRKKIITNIYNQKNKKQMFQTLENELAKGHQAYIIAPTIEQTEIENLTGVEEIYTSLKEFYQEKYNIGLLHGMMKAKDKEPIMEKFKRKEYDILVATTIIEVGIDVPNATAIMVINAERFGLATLHQIRGRVGRGTEQSYCMLYDKSNNELSKERLKLLQETDDGFKLAQKDMEFRGSGNFFGKEQSGQADFKLFNYQEDYEIAQQVIKEFQDI